MLKNRYPNVILYDRTRVKLLGDKLGDDYYHASYVDSYDRAGSDYHSLICIRDELFATIVLINDCFLFFFHLNEIISTFCCNYE